MKKDKWLRISELEKLSGTPRRTIHFYRQEGLLHPPLKTGRTMAYYDEAHLAKLKFIQKARKQGLPLAAIRHAIADSATEPSQPAAAERRPSPTYSGSDGARSRKTGGMKTRERILELGSRLFRSRGYRQTRVSSITSALNIGKGTFYFYFRDKTELFLECVPRIFNELFASGWDQIRRIDDPLTRLETRARMVLPVLREFCAILQLSREAMEETDPKVKALGEDVFRSIRRPITVDIEKGIQKGVFRPIDARIAATIFIGIMESLNDLHRVDDQPLTPETWQHVTELIISGLAAGA